MTTSRVCSVESASTRCASFSAGAYRVASALSFAASMAADHAREIGGGAHLGLRVGAEQDERGVIGRREPLHGLARRGLRARPPVAVSHAVRAIEQDDHFARSRRRSRAPRSADRRTAARTRARSAGWPRAASRAAASRECAAGARTDTESSRETSATETRRPASARAASDGSRSEWRASTSAAKKRGARNAIYLTRLRRWRADRYLNNA